jgi:hypothetical protein
MHLGFLWSTIAAVVCYCFGRKDIHDGTAAARISPTTTDMPNTGSRAPRIECVVVLCFVAFSAVLLHQVP